MEFLTKGYNALRGEKGQVQSGSETVERLCDRIEHGTLLEDRRSGVLAIKSLAREYKRDIGVRGIKVLCRSLQQDHVDVDMCKAILEILIIMSDSTRDPDPEFALDMSDIFLEDATNVALLLDILEEQEFYVRYNIVTLLTALVRNNQSRLQECILTAPMGMSRLMDLLDDRREIIRNDGLLLLISLTESNADIQKIVAFENAFERLLGIIDEEGAIAGGIIVQDCLQLVQNLLRHNVSNQNYFRETSCIQRIPELFHDETAFEDGKHNSLKATWSDQKGNNMIMVLELIRVLVVPDHSNTIPNQKSMYQCNILNLLIDLTLSSNAPQRVKASGFYALAELIRTNKINQDALSQAIITPSQPPPSPLPQDAAENSPANRNSGQFNRPSFQSERASSAMGHKANYVQRYPDPRERCPAIVELVTIIVGRYSGCSYTVRAAATCAFQCFVLENPDAQMVLATTLNPPPENNPNSVDAQPESPGTLLLAALQSWQDDPETAALDPFNSWFATVLLSHILQNNSRAKAIALAITYGDEENGEDPVSLIHSITAALMVAVKSQADVRVGLGYLALLCVWCYDSPKSIKDFLSEGAHLQFLIELINQSSKEDTMIQGLAAFLLGICYEFNWEPDALISRATIQPIILSRIGSDHFAACISRVRESGPFKSVSAMMTVLPSEEGGGLPNLYFDYAFVEFMKRTFERAQKSILLDPKSRPPPMQGGMNGGGGHGSGGGGISQDEVDSLVQNYKQTIGKQTQELQDLKHKLEEAQRLLMRQAQENQESENTIASLQDELEGRKQKHEALNKEHEDLLVCLAEQDIELNQLKNHLRSFGVQIGGGGDVGDGSGDSNRSEYVTSSTYLS